MFPPYAELHCLSNFTFLTGASRPEELVERAHELGYSALALTDECSVAGAVRAYEAARDCGLKLVVGSQLKLDDGLKLVLLATDREGYGNLCELITLGRKRAKKGAYRLGREDFASGLPGCLALWAPSTLSPKTKEVCQQGLAEADFFKDLFPNRAWIAVELLRGPDDQACLENLSRLSQQTGLPLVASGDVHMHARSRQPLQDTLTAIRLKCTVKDAGYALFPNSERHLRPIPALAELYPEELLRETVAIAERCTFSLDSLRYEYPDELVPPGETAASYLRRCVEEGLTKRLRRHSQGLNDVQKVRGLIERELALIAELKYEHFFLTVYDIVKWARDQGILCQGRGSAANSAVCYALGITEVDPARTEVLFERFISRERNEPPDIDVDFEHQRREEVMQHIYRKYGRERAAIAATVITYRPKSAIRDVGKALGLDLAQVDRLAKSLAWWDGRSTLPERLKEAGFDPQSPVIARLLALVNVLVGFPRHLSQHVGGFVISHGPISRLVPIENAAMPERTVIQWDKDDLDTLGLLKVDCLSLGMLSAIRRALALISERRGRPFTMDDVPPRDRATFEMIGRADTIGVFQIESRAQMAMLPRLKPETFYDLVVEVAIVRPGPIQGGMVHPYLERREKKEKIAYPSDAVRKVLERTLGVPIFQEQVMQLAIMAAGFTPGEADRLRRSMAAWRRSGDLHQFESRLISGMIERGYSLQYAQQIFRQIQGFGEYGFPESHSTSFALLAYVSAWLKCHEPAAFTCALLNSQPMGFYAPAQLVADARAHGVEIRPVDVMASEWDCMLESFLSPSGGGRFSEPSPSGGGRFSEPSPSGGGRFSEPSPSGGGLGWGWGSIPQKRAQPALRLGLRMIKGLPEAAAKRIAQAREKAAFSDIPDLATRASLNRGELSHLAASGALSSLAGHRREARWACAGIEASLLGKTPHIEEPRAQLWPPSEGEELVADYASLGLTLGRHPLALLRKRFNRLSMQTAAQLREIPNGRRACVAGLVTCRQRPDTASGVIFVTLEDETGMANVVVWRALIEHQRRELLTSSLLGVEGFVQREKEVIHLVASRLIDYSRWLGRLATSSRDFH